MHRTDDDVRFKALSHLTTLALIDPSAARLGRSLLNFEFAGTLCTDDEIAASVADVFASKSSGTLLKRANSMWRFSQWLNKALKGSPFSQPEHVVYLYVTFLKDSNVGATTASHFVESLNFCDGLLGFCNVKFSEMLSPRVKGSALLTVAEVPILEELCIRSEDALVRLLAGHFFFCLYSAARWHDSMHVVSCNASWCKKFCLLEAGSRKHKTSAAQHMQPELLPLTALGKGLDNEAWGESFMQARGEHGLTAKQYFLTSYSESKAKWTDHRMTMAEATPWLRNILCGQVGSELTS